MDNLKPPKDYFDTAYRGFRAISWLWSLLFIIGIMWFGSECLGRTPSLESTIWVVQSGTGLVLSLTTSQLFKNKSHSAIKMGYITLAVIIGLSTLLYFISPLSFVGALHIAILGFLFSLVFKAQKQNL